MGSDAKDRRFCDGCGELFINAHKLHQGKEYCQRCYGKEFRRIQCSTCAGKATVHRNDPRPAVCTACLASTRKCMRCEKPVPRAGKLENGGAICPSCVPYFTELKACPRCDRMTSRLSAMPEQGITEKICESCRNAVTHVTCSICRKYRKVANHAGAEPHVCIACASQNGPSHPCPGCGVSVPGLGRSQCRACLNKQALDREIKFTALVFAHEWTSTLWSRFAYWVLNRSPSDPAVLQDIRRHQLFFELLDTAYASFLELSGPRILEQFGTERLRAHQLPVKFLHEQLNIEIPDSAKKAASEAARIRKTLSAVERKPWEKLIRAYNEELLRRDITLKSQRMYLSTAAAFCANENIGEAAWHHNVLEQYLFEHPGTRNNLFSFVSFCKQNQGWHVEMPPKGSGVRALPDPVRSAKSLQQQLNRINSEGLDRSSVTALTNLFATALVLGKSSVLAAAANATATEDAIIYPYGRERIRIPEELSAHARRLTQLLSKNENASKVDTSDGVAPDENPSTR